MIQHQLVIVDGEEFYSLMEIRCGDRKFYYLGVTPEQEERALSVLQRPEWPDDVLAWGLSIAEFLACSLTPEGVHPGKKDVDALQKEILGMPFEFVCKAYTEFRAFLIGKNDMMFQ